VAIPKYNFEPFGDASVSSQGQVTVPGPAREASGLLPGTPVLVFVDRDSGYVLLTHRPDADDLLKIAPQLIEAAERAAKKRRASA
jgi:AbrB family looped-hinge helix DNA binding protein